MQRQNSARRSFDIAPLPLKVREMSLYICIQRAHMTRMNVIQHLKDPRIHEVRQLRHMLRGYASQRMFSIAARQIYQTI